MADVSITPHAPAATGTTLSETTLAVSTTYQVANTGGDVVIVFRKTGASDATITFVTPQTVAGLAVANPTATVPATTGYVVCGPFPKATYNNSAGEVEFSTNEATNLYAAAIKI